MSRQVCHAHCPPGGTVLPLLAVLAVLAAAAWAVTAVIDAAGLAVIISMFAAGVCGLGYAGWVIRRDGMLLWRPPAPRKTYTRVITPAVVAVRPAAISAPRRRAIEPAPVVHHHLHLHGLDGGQLAEVLGRQGRLYGTSCEHPGENQP